VSKLAYLIQCQTQFVASILQIQDIGISA
jgi:hypothetical protein